ncbi:MAG: hypothetical protein GC181_07970 [Bacteroidetes bacterium]|nr:hypothetical protein [Bacteroidota bacterium]
MTKAWLLISLVFSVAIASTAFAQEEEQDTILPDGRKGSIMIQVLPCDCDSLRHDSISVALNNCFDTSCHVQLVPSILDFVDSVAEAFGVPYELIYEIGMNESRWPNIYDHSYLIKDGDLQIIERSFFMLYKELKLTGGKTRQNYIIAGVYYLKKNYDLYGSWKKARYAYGRGRWRPESQWTSLERRFMNKIDWTKYDGVQTKK